MIAFGRLRLSLQQAIALGMALIILAGALALSLPACSRDGTALPFSDALFTSTSAVCVTGLVVRDTYTQFSRPGQLVLLLLIQVGGLGFMSLVVFFLFAMGRKISLRERSLLMEAVNTPQIGGTVRLVKRILAGTVLFELMGAALLALRFFPLFGPGEGAFFALFHAVSAFCNAGFDLMGVREPFSSLTAFRDDPLVVLTIAALIVIGGLGFVVWDDLLKNRFRLRRCLLHTRVVLLMTGLLILLGAAAYWVLERDHSLRGLTAGERLLAALFQAVSPRTAGFNTVDLSRLGAGGSLLTMALMFVGASPGSTGGGVKTSTLAVVLLSMWAFIRGRGDVNLFGRRLEAGVVRRAASALFVYVTLLVCGLFLLLAGQTLPFEQALFELFSAIGTVGLTMGITTGLNAFSRLVVILLMYAGRIGSLTLMMALAEGHSPRGLRNPEDRVIIG